MGKRIFLFVICIVFLVGVCLDAYAFYGKNDKHMQERSLGSFFKRFDRILKAQEQLNLSKDQVSKIENEIINAEKEMIRGEAEIAIISLDIKMGLKQDKINIKAINKLIDKKYELKKIKMKILVEAYAKIKDILTKEQKDMMSKIYKGRKLELGECCCMNKKSKGSRCSYEYSGRELCPVR